MNSHDPLPIIIRALMAKNGFDEQFLPKVLQDIRPYVQQLRKVYQQSPCDVDYGNPYMRGAYMLAYFPYYIEPIYTVLSGVDNARILPILNRQRISVCVFGSGPAPEALGLMAYLRQRCPDCTQAHFLLFDAVAAGWKGCISLCFDQLQPHYWNGQASYSLKSCDLRGQCNQCNCTADVQRADLVIMQNCLNDIIANPDETAEKVVTIFRKMQPGALFVCIDLIFAKIQRALRGIKQRVTSAGLGDVVYTAVEAAYKIPGSFSIPPEMMEHLYTGEDGLIAKRRVKIYALGLRRIA